MGRKSKAKIRRQEILSHFYEVVIEEGYEGASIAKVAQRMGVNPSLLIHYFTTKNAMVLGLIEYILNTYSNHLFPDFSQSTNPEQRWEDVVDVVSQLQWDRIMNHKAFYSSYALCLRESTIRQRFVDLYDHLRKQLCQEIQHADAAGVIRVEDPMQTATLILYMIEGSNYFQAIESNAEDLNARAEFIKSSIQRLLPRHS